MTISFDSKGPLSIEAEYKDADLGDPRQNKRLLKDVTGLYFLWIYPLPFSSNLTMLDTTDAYAGDCVNQG